MKPRARRAGTLVALWSAMVVAPVAAQAEHRTRLSGYDETPNTINTPASGEFRAKLRDGGTSIDYELTYRDTPTPVTQAHIHFGLPATSGGIVLFLCTNLTPPTGVPAPPGCPPAPATVTGTLSAADVIAVPTQGIDAGAAGFPEILRAIREGAAYANVHTSGRPSGEIRGRLRGHGFGR